MLLVLGNAVADFSGVAEGGSIDSARTHLQDINKSEADGSADNGRCAVRATQHIEITAGANLLTKPVNCPPVICCLLPCLYSLPSMRAFAASVPEDALVLREGEWCDVEATSVVRGDVVLLQEGETAPADFSVLSSTDDFEISLKAVNGSRMTHRPGPEAQVALGAVCLHGNCRGVVTAIADETLLAQRLGDGKWPPRS